MAMTKKEQAAMNEAITRAEILGALRWTTRVERDVPPPNPGEMNHVRYAEGWDFNLYTRTVSQYWSSSYWSGSMSHSEGAEPGNRPGIYLSGRQGSRSLYSTKLRALQALRYETEREAARALREIDVQIREETEGEASHG